MVLCRNCGVEIEEDQALCPLCGLPPGEEPVSTDTGEANTPFILSEKRESALILFWEIFSFTALSTILIVFVVDFAYGLNITWSRYPMVCLGFVWITIFLILKVKRRIGLLFFLMLLNLLLFLFLLELSIQGKPWFWALAFPLTISFSFLALITYGLIRRFKPKLLTIFSICLLQGGVFILFLELILNLFLYNKPFISWSMVASACMIPIIGFLINFDSRLKKRGSSLKKYFHI